MCTPRDRPKAPENDQKSRKSRRMATFSCFLVFRRCAVPGCTHGAHATAALPRWVHFGHFDIGGNRRCQNVENACRTAGNPSSARIFGVRGEQPSLLGCGRAHNVVKNHGFGLPSPKPCFLTSLVRSWLARTCKARYEILFWDPSGSQMRISPERPMGTVKQGILATLGPYRSFWLKMAL